MTPRTAPARSLHTDALVHTRVGTPVSDFDAFYVLHDQHPLVDHARLNLGHHHLPLHMGALAVQVGLTPPRVGCLMLKVQLLHATCVFRACLKT